MLRHCQLVFRTTHLRSAVRMASTRRSARVISQGKPESMPPPPKPTKFSKANPPAASKKTGSRIQNKRPASPTSAAPSTPTKRRVTGTLIEHTPEVPPLTPTPSAVGLIAEPHDQEPPATPSPSKRSNSKKGESGASLLGSNAVLVSPESSRVLPTPSTGGHINSDNLLEVANKYLINVDQKMRPLVEKHHCRLFSPEGLAETIDPFESLVSGIVSQQVSGAAAKSIKNKFIALFHQDGHFPHPSEVVSKSKDELRTAGLSNRKAEYILGLAEKFKSGELTAQMLRDAPYEEVLEKLIAVRGLGRWSVEMFACFALKRLDVFSTGDLGVQRGMAAFVGRDIAKLKAKGGKWKYMKEDEMEELAKRFKPYRTLFMWYMWRVEETDVSTME